MRSWLLRLAAITLVVGLPPAVRTESALACSCGEPPGLWESVEDATAVFAGRVVALESRGNTFAVDVTFAVSRVWKGPAAPELVAYTRSLGAGDCGYPLELEEEYLVYAYDEALEIWLCTRTTRLMYAEYDLEALGEGRVPVAGATGEVEVVVPPPPGAPNVGIGATASHGAAAALFAMVAVVLAGASFAAVSRRRARRT